MSPKNTFSPFFAAVGGMKELVHIVTVTLCVPENISLHINDNLRDKKGLHEQIL